MTEPTVGIKNDTKEAPPKWHAPDQGAKYYDWVLDIADVLKRYNSAYQTSIRTRPIDAVLENNITWKEFWK